MKKTILVATLLALTGCGAAVDFAVVSGGVTVLEPYINNNPNAKAKNVDNRPRCSYVKSQYLIIVDICPLGVPAGTRIYP